MTVIVLVSDSGLVIEVCLCVSERGWYCRFVVVCLVVWFECICCFAHASCCIYLFVCEEVRISRFTEVGVQRSRSR